MTARAARRGQAPAPSLSLSQTRLGWLHDRQIGRLLAPENPAGVDAGLTIGIGEVQAAGRGKFTSFINRRNGMARCQRNDSIALAVKERVGVNQQRSGA
jgi:hypothetical protein